MSSPNALAATTKRASTLAVSAVERGSTTTVNGRLDVGGNGCVRAGGVYLIAPTGSGLRDHGATVFIAGVGSYRVGSWMPTLSARVAFSTHAQLPRALASCGPGGYIAVSSHQDQPVLVFDSVDDSTRMVVRSSRAVTTPTTRISSAMIGKRNTCVTVGDAFLSAPHGSTVFDHGRSIHLVGIGTFRVGGTLPAQQARLVTYTDHSVPPGLIDCGPGTYAEVVPR